MPTTPYNRAGPGQPIKNALMPQPAAYDEWGNPYDAAGNSLARPNMSLGEIALTGLAAPVTAGVGIAGALSPYGVEEGWRVPPAIKEPYEAGKRFLSPGGGFANMPDQQSTQDATTLLFSMYGGNALRGAVRNAAATNALADMGRALSDTGRPNPLGSAIGSALDMSPEARLARAREQGFDTDTTWYHGTTGDFDSFNKSMFGSVTGADGAKKATFFSSDPDIAGAYVDLAPSRDYTDLIKLQEEAMAKGNSAEFDRIEGILESFQQKGVPLGGNIIPARLTNNLQPFDFYGLPWEDGAMVRAMDSARAAGFHGVEFKNIADHPYDRTKLSNVAAVFDPSNIRSVNAAFDPARAGENGLLLSDTGRPSLLGSAIASGAEQGKPIRAYHGTRFASEPLDTYPVTDGMASAGDAKKRLWASSDADVASSYAEPIGSDLYWNELYPSHTGHTPPPRSGGVFPVEMNFANPLEVDAAGAGFQSVPWEGQIYSADELAYLAQAMGHDGLIVKSLQDHMYDQNHAPSTVYAALKRGTVRSPLTGETLFSDTGRPSLLGSALASEQGKGITAYHGSPHSFDKFDMSKIGSGEGAQAYGHGLYFAENEGVARSYKTNLSGDYYFSLNGDEVTKDQALAIEYLQASSLNPERAKQQMRYDFDPGESYTARLEKLIDDMSSADWKQEFPGHMYQVRINANPEDFLDWDKPLSQQSEKARNALASRFADDPVRSQDLQYEGGASTPSYILRNAADAETTKALREAGIPGIKYLDQMSRTAGDGSRNYVVFDDNLVEIMKKYGLAGALYGGTNSLYQEEGK